MSKLNQPMLAATYKDGMQLPFPLLMTPKIDGIRALIVNGKLVSRSFKLIPNVRIRTLLEDLLPEGADGEIQCGTFQETTSIVMSHDRTPEKFEFFWFDWAYDVNAPYEQRTKMLWKYFAMSIRHIIFKMKFFRSKQHDETQARTHTKTAFTLSQEQSVDVSKGAEQLDKVEDVCSECGGSKRFGPTVCVCGRWLLECGFRFTPLMPEMIYDMYSLKEREKFLLSKNYEGMVVRSPNGIYKSGKSTVSEGFMIKIKPYDDYEAVAIGTEELMHNNNDASLDNFGKSKRSSRKDGKVPGDTLGAIIVKTPDDIMFKIGTGFTAEERKVIWLHRNELIGRYIKYRCVITDKHDVPRSAVFLGIRDKDDM